MIDELIERVEKGEGADRELDGMVAAAMHQPQRNGWKPWACPGGYVLTETGDKPRPGMGQFIPAPIYTTSLDAVIALIGEKLPGWIVAVVGQSDDRSWWAELRRGHLTSYDKVALSHLKCSGPARAALAAFLKAHKEQHDG